MMNDTERRREPRAQGDAWSPQRRFFVKTAEHFDTADADGRWRLRETLGRVLARFPSHLGTSRGGRDGH